MSQAVEPNHPNGLEFLLRDCRNISEFFTKKNVHDVKSPEEMFSEITGVPLEAGASDAEILCQVLDIFQFQILSLSHLICSYVILKETKKSSVELTVLNQKKAIHLIIVGNKSSKKAPLLNPSPYLVIQDHVQEKLPGHQEILCPNLLAPTASLNRPAKAQSLLLVWPDSPTTS